MFIRCEKASNEWFAETTTHLRPPEAKCSGEKGPLGHSPVGAAPQKTGAQAFRSVAWQRQRFGFPIFLRHDPVWFSRNCVGRRVPKFLVCEVVVIPLPGEGTPPS